ncbi:hypothetical protein pipiens_006581 [Culex pipiens pipiens]|uniref:Uncharacterized protein n=1 Tax=Culex pipiens pipiens TaxID=38569 RepID=A0ABD1DPC6_CULPP
MFVLISQLNSPCLAASSAVDIRRGPFPVASVDRPGGVRVAVEDLATRAVLGRVVPRVVPSGPGAEVPEDVAACAVVAALAVHRPEVLACGVAEVVPEVLPVPVVARSCGGGPWGFGGWPPCCGGGGPCIGMWPPCPPWGGPGGPCGWGGPWPGAIWGGPCGGPGGGGWYGLCGDGEGAGLCDGGPIGLGACGGGIGLSSASKNVSWASLALGNNSLLNVLFCAKRFS